MDGDSRQVVAHLLLTRVPRRSVVSAMARMALDRRHLRAIAGLRFWKLLGTGNGRTFTPGDADLRTWALLTVWDDEVSLDRFLASSPTCRAWAGLADAHWSARMRPMRWRGSWSGRDPFAGATPVDDAGGPIAVITRARVRPSQWWAFARAVPPVSLALLRCDGLDYRVGIGELPIGLQGTFSVWTSAAALDAFAYGNAAHRSAIERTHQTGWYAEELFVRFAVTATDGSLDAFEERSPSLLS